MHRLLIAAATAAFLAVTASAAMAQNDYPPCTATLHDNCRETGHQSHDWPRHHHHPHH
jgi:hypothetical protein